MNRQQKHYKLGVFYGTDPDTEMLAQKFVGNLINDDEFCKACELFEKDVKCDKCREHLGNFSNSIFFYDKLGENVPDFIEDPEDYLPKSLPQVDFIMVVGIHQDLLSGLPEYLKDKNIKAVIIPVENPKWVQPGLQVQVLEAFENYGIQAAFPKPFCALSKELDEYNKEGFNITRKRNFIYEFIDHYKIGVPIVSILLSEDGKSIEDSCVLQFAPCGSSYFIIKQLKAKYL